MNDRWRYLCTSCGAQEINTRTQHFRSHQAMGLEHYCREMLVSKGENYKENEGRTGGGRNRPFDK